jgi:hypothetical protein
MSAPSRFRGDFGFRPLVDIYTPRLEDMHPQATRFGLPLQGIWAYGALRGEEGNLYGLYRKLVGPLTSGLGLMALRDGVLRVDPASVRAARGAITRRIDPDVHVYEGQPMPGEQPFALRVDDTTMGWSEGDIMSIEATLGGPGFQVYMPGRTESAFYASQLYRAEGTILGKPVRGFTLFDQSYMPSGIDWRESIIFEDLEHVWGSFASEYEDGSLEWGHLAFGRKNFAFAVIANDDGPILVTTDVEGGVDVEADDWASRILFRAGGQEWEWIADPDGRLGDFSASRRGYLAQTGWTRRLGETRKPRRWFAWQETFPDRIRDDRVPAATAGVPA